MSKDFMKKTAGYLIILFILGTALDSCRKKEDNDCPQSNAYKSLTASAKEWFPYTSNRNLIFESSALVRDTLILSNYSLSDEEVWNGDKCPVTRAEFLRGNIIDKKSGDTIKAELGNGDQVIFKKKTAFIFYLDNNKLLLQASAFRRFESTITLNNKTYTSVLVFECSAEDKCIPAGITKFYFSKTKGLVAYQRNGVFWTLR